MDHIGSVCMPKVVFRHLQCHNLLWIILNVPIKISQMYYIGMHCIFHTTSTKSMWPCLTNDITREVISFQTFWHLKHNFWTIFGITYAIFFFLFYSDQNRKLMFCWSNFIQICPNKILRCRVC